MSVEKIRFNLKRRNKMKMIRNIICLNLFVLVILCIIAYGLKWKLTIILITYPIGMILGFCIGKIKRME